jgi:hypothetical protein
MPHSVYWYYDEWQTMFMLTVLLLLMPSGGDDSVYQVRFGSGIVGGWYAPRTSRSLRIRLRSAAMV